MNVREPATPLSDRIASSDLHWHARDRAPVPQALAHLGDIAVGSRLPFERPVVCLSPIELHALRATIEDIRGEVGDDAYFIAVFRQRPGADHICSAVDCGADDTLVLDDPDCIATCFARARRAVQERRRSATYRKRYQVERNYLQACIDNLPTPIFFKNARGLYVGCNKAFEAYLGLTADKIIGSSVYDIAPPDLARTYEAADNSLMERGGVQVYEANVRFSDGSIRDVSFHKAVITDRQGAARGLAGAMLDITERKKLERRLQEAAERDPLTNSLNRRSFFEKAIAITAACAVEGRPVSLAVVDIDHFKSVNDRFGHAAGDRVLCQVASTMEQQVGEGNIVARAGGEEFFIILQGCGLKAAGALMERMRAEVAGLDIPEIAGLPVTVSIGLAGFDRRDENLWDCLKRADHALYQAKHGGRNCIARAA